MTPMKWFYSFLKEYRLRIVLGFVLVTVMASLAIISPRISGSIVDRVIQGGDYAALPGLLAVLLGATVCRSILRFIVPYNFETCSQGRCGLSETPGGGF